MAKTSEARAKVTLDSNSFEKGAKRVISAAESMSSTLTTAFATAGAAVLLALGANTISGLAHTVKETLNFGEAMANAGKRAGIAAGQFYLFNSAVEKGIGLKTAAGLLGKNAEVLNWSANVFRDVSIKLWAIGEKIRGFWLGLMERVAPVLSTILDGALGDQLLAAGNNFGEAIANGIATLYQLAKDGKLWGALKEGFGIAFDYAGERLEWLAGKSYEVLKTVFSAAFLEGAVEAFQKVWGAITSFGENVADVLGSALHDAITDAFESAFKWVEKIDRWLNRDSGKEGKDLVESRKQERNKYIQDRRDTSDSITDKDGRNSALKIADKIQEIFSKKGEFNQSGGLAWCIGQFGKGLQETFTKYQREQTTNPPKTFENNSRRVASGADSFAAIGAGGNVYMGLSLLDVNKSQLNELRQINQKLGSQKPAQNVNNHIRYVGDVTREQTRSTVV